MLRNRTWHFNRSSFWNNSTSMDKQTNAVSLSRLVSMVKMMWGRRNKSCSHNERKKQIGISNKRLRWMQTTLQEKMKGACQPKWQIFQLNELKRTSWSIYYLASEFSMFMFSSVCYLSIYYLSAWPVSPFMLLCCYTFASPLGWIKSTLAHPVYKYNVGCGNLSDIYFSPETNPTWLLLGNMIEAFVDGGFRRDRRSCNRLSTRVTWFSKIPKSVQKTDCAST